MDFTCPNCSKFIKDDFKVMDQKKHSWDDSKPIVYIQCEFCGGKYIPEIKLQPILTDIKIVCEIKI